MRSLMVSCLLSSVLIVGCVSSRPKTVLVGPNAKLDQMALVYPDNSPFLLMGIKSVDGKSTWEPLNGPYGPLYVPPGQHTFQVILSGGMKRINPRDPKWAVPSGAVVAPILAESTSVNMHMTYQEARFEPIANLEPGKKYTIRFGYSEASDGGLIPVTWVEEILQP